MIKRIVSVLLALLTVALAAVMLWQGRQEKQEIALKNEQVQTQIGALTTAINDLNTEINTLEQSYLVQQYGTGSLTLLFTDAAAQIYTDAFPAMQERGWTGTLAISSESFPGKEGAMTVAQFTELLAAGWDWCLSWPTEERFPQDSIWEMADRAESDGFGRSGMLYFPDGSYAEEYDGWLAENGFTIAVHHGESGKALIVSDTAEGCWYPGALNWRSENRRYQLSEAIDSRGNLVFSVTMRPEEAELDATYMQSMLDLLATSSDRGELQIRNLSGALDYRQTLEAGRDEITAEWERRRADLALRIAALQEEIADLYGGYQSAE